MSGRMKNSMYGAAILIAACFSCASPEAKECVVKGEVKGYGDGLLCVMAETLSDYDVDTIEVKNGCFTYRSSLEHPTQLIFLATDNAACDKRGTYSFRLLAGNSNAPIRVKAEVEKKLENAEITGSRVQTELEKINSVEAFRRLRKIQWQRDSLSRTEDTVAYKMKCTEFDGMVNPCLDQLFALDFAPKSTAMVYTLHSYFSFLSVDELEKALQRLAPDIEWSVYLERMQERIRRTRIMALGRIAPEFTLEDVNGQKYHLSDFKGKMVLLDFTASWCHWCKVEIPYIEAVYKEMQGKDFEIVSVYLDKKREDWVKDVEKSHHPWKCLSDVKAWEKGGMAYDYFIGGIPNLIILDRDGRIISKGTRGEETLQFIREHYK